jgi:hypothetical protein
VYEGPLRTCEQIAAILADGGLRVTVQ